MQRRALLQFGLAGLAGPALAAWPERAVKIVVPSAPGDAGDTLGRVLAAEFERLLGKPFVVENRAGTGGRLASEAVAAAPPNGLTLMIANAGSHGINAALYRHLPYDVERDFAPISLLLEAPSVLVVNPRTLPVRDVADLVTAARAQPGGLPYASGGIGGSAHMTMELFRARAGIAMEHVPFRGAGGAVAGLLAGEPALMFVNLPSVTASLQRGDLRPLAVTSLGRDPSLPDVPTLDEAGFPGFEALAWFGLVAPARTPSSALAAIRDATARVMALPTTAQRIRAIGDDPRGSTAEDFAVRIAKDVAMWKALAAEQGIVAD